MGRVRSRVRSRVRGRVKGRVRLGLGVEFHFNTGLQFYRLQSRRTAGAIAATLYKVTSGVYFVVSLAFCSLSFYIEKVLKFKFNFFYN